MSRGISKEKAIELIILGFTDEFKKELPMEYAIELNQLLKQKLIKLIIYNIYSI